MNFHGRISSNVLIGLFIGIWFVFLSVLYSFQMDIPLPLMAEFSWDEYHYLYMIYGVHRSMLNGAIKDLFLYPPHYGYGSIFWIAYGVPSNAFTSYLESESGFFLYVLRLITVLFQCSSALVACKIIQELGSKRLGMLLFFALILFMPGLVLTLKPFSPDYLGVFLILSGIYFLIRGIKSDLEVKLLLLSGIFLGLASSVKLSNAIAVTVYIAFGVCYYLHYGKSILSNFFKGIGAIVCGGAIGFIAGTPSVVFSVSKYYEYLTEVKQINNPNNMFALKGGLFDRFIYWFDNPFTRLFHEFSTVGIRLEYFGYGMVFMILCLISQYLLRKNKRNLNHSLSLSLVLMGILCILITIALTNRVWTWYIISFIFISSIGVVGLLESFLKDLKSLPSNKRNLIFVIVGVIFTSHICYGVVGITTKIKQSQISEKILAEKNLLRQSCTLQIERDFKNAYDHQFYIDHNVPRTPLRRFQLRWCKENVDCFENEMPKMNRERARVVVIRETELPESSRPLWIANGFHIEHCAPGYLLLTR